MSLPRKLSDLEQNRIEAECVMVLDQQVDDKGTDQQEARRMLTALRDRGFDVVATGNAPPRDSTLVLDRTNHPEWARLVASV